MAKDIAQVFGEFIARGAAAQAAADEATSLPNVKVGQIWRDQDKRKKRHVRVLRLSPNGERVTVETIEKVRGEWRRKKGVRDSDTARNRFGRQGDHGFTLVGEP